MAPSESKESKLLSSKAKEEGKIIQKVTCKISGLIIYKETGCNINHRHCSPHALVLQSSTRIWMDGRKLLVKAKMQSEKFTRFKLPYIEVKLLNFILWKQQSFIPSLVILTFKLQNCMNSFPINFY